MVTCGREAAERAKDRNQEGRTGADQELEEEKRDACGNVKWRFREQRTDGRMPL